MPEASPISVVDLQNEDPIAKVKEPTKGQGAKYAVEAAGKTSTMEAAVQSIRYGDGIALFAGHEYELGDVNRALQNITATTIGRAIIRLS